jgi:SAM-dependent methyltransferase
LDIGCGSDIHSLAAIRMGASRVISFEYDPDSVATTQTVRQTANSPVHWTVMQGSVLDDDFMASLPKADVVYSWGVLHHTGDTWHAMQNAALPLKEDGLFYISLYSSDMCVDPPPQYWLAVKRRYNASGPFTKRLMVWGYFLRFHFIPELMAGRNPMKFVRAYGERGMDHWTVVKDWLGGWPMDFTSLAETQAFCRKKLGLTPAEAGRGGHSAHR